MPIHIHTSIVKSLPFIRLSYSDQSKRFDRTIRFEPFSIKVLDIRRTLIENGFATSFSFETDVVKALSTKYVTFTICITWQTTKNVWNICCLLNLKKDLSELLIHDQQEFDIPEGWQTKTIKESPLFKEFSTLWTILSVVYQNELTPLAFSDIPDKKLIAESFMKILKQLQK